MGMKFWGFVKGILLRGETSNPSDNLEGSIWHNSTDNKLRSYLGAAVREVTTNDQTQTLTNKILDGDTNTIQDLALASLKTNLTDANKFIVRDASGIAISNTKAVPTGVVVGTTDTQTLTNKTIDADLNTISNIDNADIKSGAAIARNKLASGTADHVIINDGSGVLSSEATLAKVRGGSGQDNSGLTFPATGTLATLAGTETLTNKTIGNTNTITAKDTLFTLQDDVDTTKQLQFQLSGIATATTRTLTAPNANTTIVGTDATQTLTNKSIDADANTITNIDNADIKTGAAIDRAKLASGSANHVIINDGSGVLSSEAQLAISRGGTNGSTATTGFNNLSPLTTKGDIITRDTTNNIRLPVGTDGFILTADSAQAAGIKWATAASAAGAGTWTVSTKTTTYTAAINDFILADATSGAFTITLPTVSGNSGKRIGFFKFDTTNNVVTLSSADGINVNTTVKMSTYGECITVTNNGVAWYIENKRIQDRDVSTTPITITGSGSNPTKGTTTRDNFRYHRVGGWMSAQYNFRQTTAGTGGSGTYLLALPSGLTVDTGRMEAGGSNTTTTIGFGRANTSNGTYTVTATLNTTSNFFLVFDNATTDLGIFSSSFNSFGNPDIEFSVNIFVPITNWEG